MQARTKCNKTKYKILKGEVIILQNQTSQIDNEASEQVRSEDSHFPYKQFPITESDPSQIALALA